MNSLDGKVFERGHKNLGDLLGFISENPNTTGAPDPYWIINENNVIVSEDKIYEERDKIKVFQYQMLVKQEGIQHG